jgi:SAM-dependent methyltransferase
LCEQERLFKFSEAGSFMDTKQVYSNKAEKYGRYRWDYASQAITSIFTLARLNDTSCVADIGAGTGILTRHLAGRVRQVFALEPNPEMRRVAESELAAKPGCVILAASAENTTLDDSSIDLITVAQAIHWFDPEPARREFRRILKPGGWLAILGNRGTNDGLNRAIAELHKGEYGFDGRQSPLKREWKPLIYYYGNGRFQRIRLPFVFQQNWGHFYGALLSTAGMPDESSPAIKRLERAAREVFERFSSNGIMEVRGETDLYIGQVTGVD